MINIIKDRDLIDDVRSYDVVLVGLNIKNTMGNGFQKQIARSFRYVYDINMGTNYNDEKKLGTCLVVPERNGNPIFVLCYITKGRFRPDIIPDSLDYEALERCLRRVNDNFKGKRIASTIMGVDKYEAGGDKDRVLDIFEKVFDEADITLYDYEQQDYRQQDNERYHKIINDYKTGKISRSEYEEQKKMYFWERNFGKYEPMPENLSYGEMKDLKKP